LSNLSLLQEFPSDFIFGVATSSYQIEGNSYGGCGKSIWDDFAQRKLNGVDGQKACNHYSFFKEDIKLIKEAGFKAYRFSFAWPRLFPENDNQINQEGVDFYHRLLEEIHANDLEPFPTLYHWDLPIRFLKNGAGRAKIPAKDLQITLISSLKTLAINLNQLQPLMNLGAYHG
jgi:beta-glucosidase